MEIDNFDIFRSQLTFEKAKKFDPNTGNIEVINDTYDRYIMHIIKRAKDTDGKKYGVNTSNRLIKTYEISSLEYFDKKKHISSTYARLTVRERTSFLKSGRRMTVSRR